MVEGQSMTVADVVAGVRDGRFEDFVREAVALIARDPGAPLLVNGRPLTFSFLPVRRNTRRYGLNDVVFAIDAWAVIEGAVNDQVSTGDRDESLAFVAQARAFFEAAHSRTPASPLLTYYAFLTLGKAIIRCRGFGGSLDRARHGLSDRRPARALPLVSAVPATTGPDLSSGAVTSTIPSER